MSPDQDDAENQKEGPVTGPGHGIRPLGSLRQSTSFGQVKVSGVGRHYRGYGYLFPAGDAWTQNVRRIQWPARWQCVRLNMILFPKAPFRIRNKAGLSVINLTNISKRYGHQILFVETSFQLNPGRKGGPGRSQRGRQDHRISVDHRRAKSRRGNRLGSQAHHHRLLPAGYRGNVGPQCPGRDHRRLR